MLLIRPNPAFRSVFVGVIKHIDVIVNDGARLLPTIRKSKDTTSPTKGELLLNVDSDEVLPSTLIEECVNKTCNEKFEALFIPTIDWGRTYIGKSRCLGNIINLSLKEETQIPNSALRFYFKHVFEKVGGYDEDLLVGEDVIFGIKCIKHGFKIGRCKSYILHYGTEGLRNIFLKKYAYGRTFRVYQEKAKEFNLLPYREYTKVGLFYLQHCSKFKTYSKYLPGFFIVKLIEMLGLMMGNILASY
ncbi:MAG: hypothetical protein QW279_06460 [Candidatus Jordarchaeaceae archaeon]